MRKSELDLGERQHRQPWQSCGETPVNYYKLPTWLQDARDEALALQRVKRMGEYAFAGCIALILLIACAWALVWLLQWESFDASAAAADYAAYAQQQQQQQQQESRPLS